MADCNRKEEQNQQQEHRRRAKSPRNLGVLSRAAWPCCLRLRFLVCAQQPRLYREGNSWVEEITGTLPPAHELRVTTDIGSVQVQGNSPHMYLHRSQAFVLAAAPKRAKRQFDHLHISAGKTGETDSIEGKATSKKLERLGAEFILQVPRDLSLLKSADARWLADVQFDCGDDRGYDGCGSDQAGRSGRAGEDRQRRRQRRGR